MAYVKRETDPDDTTTCLRLLSSTGKKHATVVTAQGDLHASFHDAIRLFPFDRKAILDRLIARKRSEHRGVTQSGSGGRRADS